MLFARWFTYQAISHMWQSQVEIKHHSVAYFDHITVTVRSAKTQYFRYGWGSYSLCKLMNTWHIYTARMSPTANGSSVLKRFKHSNAIEIRNGTMFNFYLGPVPHIWPSVWSSYGRISEGPLYYNHCAGMVKSERVYILDQELMSAGEGASNWHTFVVPSSVKFSASKTCLIR